MSLLHEDFELIFEIVTAISSRSPSSRSKKSGFLTILTACAANNDFDEEVLISFRNERRFVSGLGELRSIWMRLFPMRLFIVGLKYGLFGGGKQNFGFSLLS